MQDQQSGNLKIILTVTAVIVAAITVVGFLWFLFLAPQAGDIGSVGWYLFAFAAGLTMIILPCTLPLAFVIVPLAMGKGLVKGLGMSRSCFPPTGCLRHWRGKQDSHSWVRKSKTSRIGSTSSREFSHICLRSPR